MMVMTDKSFSDSEFITPSKPIGFRGSRIDEFQQVINKTIVFIDTNIDIYNKDRSLIIRVESRTCETSKQKTL